VDQALAILRDAGETAWTLGQIATVASEPFVEFQP
jgi:hypothetical protein